jgi:hypothetical protein
VDNSFCASVDWSGPGFRVASEVPIVQTTPSTPDTPSISIINNDLDSDGVQNKDDSCADTPSYAQANRAGCPFPYMSRFQTYSTDLSPVKLNYPVVDFVLGNEMAKIKFNQPVKLMSSNNPLYIEDYTSISADKISIDTTMLPELNKSATLTFNNISFANPVVLKDGVRCDDCIISNYTGGVLVVDVQHFTSYQIVDESYFNAPACAENWSCGDWSACSETGQTRICSDANNCEVFYNKPSVWQRCEFIIENETTNETLNPITCVPNCGDIECGADNGCGEMCWSCIDGETCDVETNKCVQPSKVPWAWIIFGLIVLILAGVGYWYFRMRANVPSVQTNPKPNQQMYRSFGARK